MDNVKKFGELTTKQKVDLFKAWLGGADIEACPDGCEWFFCEVPLME